MGHCLVLHGAQMAIPAQNAWQGLAKLTAKDDF